MAGSKTTLAQPSLGPMPAAGKRGLITRPHRLSMLDRYFTLSAVAPTLLIMLIVFGLPLLFSAYLSLHGWSANQGIFDGPYVGLANYDDLLHDPGFLRSLWITLLYTAVMVAAQLGLGLAMALALNVDLPLIGFFRTVLIIPMMLTPIVAALTWRLLLDPSHGIINYLLGTNIVWLADPVLAFLSVGVVNIWQNAPYVAVILLAGLRSIPSESLEAASIDGANRLQKFWYIVLPLLQPYLMVALLIRTIFEFRSFDNVYVMTNGGPADATMLLSIFTYMVSFVQFDMSYGAAASWLMLAISLLLCLFFVVMIRRRRMG
ncbi:MAG: sugar ABC transporter permease [Geminicoccaceae bacterium]